MSSPVLCRERYPTPTGLFRHARCPATFGDSRDGQHATASLASRRAPARHPPCGLEPRTELPTSRPTAFAQQSRATASTRLRTAPTIKPRLYPDFSTDASVKILLRMFFQRAPCTVGSCARVIGSGERGSVERSPRPWAVQAAANMGRDVLEHKNTLSAQLVEPVDFERAESPVSAVRPGDLHFL